MTLFFLVSIVRTIYRLIIICINIVQTYICRVAIFISYNILIVIIGSIFILINLLIIVACFIYFISFIAFEWLHASWIFNWNLAQFIMSPAQDIWRIHIFLYYLLFKLIILSMLAASKIIIILIISVPVWRGTRNTKIVIWRFEIKNAFKFFRIFQAFFVIFKFIMLLFDRDFG